MLIIMQSLTGTQQESGCGKSLMDQWLVRCHVSFWHKQVHSLQCYQLCAFFLPKWLFDLALHFSSCGVTVFARTSLLTEYSVVKHFLIHTAAV